MTLRSPLITRYTPIYRHAAIVGTVGMALTIFVTAGQKPVKQDDWPVPKTAQPVVSLKTHIDPLKLQLRGQDVFFGPAGVGPDYDWPNPRGPKGLTADQLGFINQLELQLISQDKFFGPAGVGPDYDYPNPRGAKGLTADQLGFVNQLELQLISQDTFFGPPGMGPDYDWPNPQWPRQRNEFGFNNPVEIWLIGQDTFFGAPGQGPANLDWPVPKIAKGLAADQLGFVDPTEYWMLNSIYPFSQNNWPNQQQYQPRQRNEYGFTDTYKVLLFAIPPPPFYLLDWPNPKGRPPIIDQSGMVDGTNVWMIGKDQFFTSAGQGPVYDWPVPQRLRSINIDQVSYNTNLLSVVFAPFTQSDWPVPQRLRSINIDQVSYNVNLLSITFAPFNQYDWPVPQRARYLVADQLGYIDPTEFWLLVQPFAQYDWQNPQRAKFVVNPDQSYNLNQFVVFYPFDQFDWPNPRGPVYREVGWLDQFDLNLLGQDTFFGAAGQPLENMDWPVPKGRQPILDQFGAAYSINIRLVGQDTFFGAAGVGPTYDWPNPQKPRQRNEFGFIEYQVALFPFVQPPFYLTDWPNPRGYLNLSNITFIRQTSQFKFTLEKERVATPSYERRTVNVSLDNRIQSMPARPAATPSVETRKATEPVEIRTAIPPEDTE